MEHEWGTMKHFTEVFNAQTASVQGSGWGWLLYNSGSGLLEFRKTQNQDTPSDLGADLHPLLTIDVWEHAYYLKYQNRRADYLQAIWNVLNWDVAEEFFKKA
ncbi:Fe-Mn family superoxide dismutase [Thermus thermophilus]|uniref:Fe-Mn family superoxide dismutase n=1 Tax=Thermus thermophilus TaxID=274 RepID=UPI00241F5EF9|nr:Fe-Mn family superoxide dismutase [Thermus thermophilus]